jgi:hypothetical protein
MTSRPVKEIDDEWWERTQQGNAKVLGLVLSRSVLSRLVLADSRSKVAVDAERCVATTQWGRYAADCTVGSYCSYSSRADIAVGCVGFVSATGTILHCVVL